MKWASHFQELQFHKNPSERNDLDDDQILDDDDDDDDRSSY